MARIEGKEIKLKLLSELRTAIVDYRIDRRVEEMKESLQDRADGGFMFNMANGAFLEMKRRS